MFKRKLFKRALPVILSVAMIFQSMPATALAAENEMTEVVETTVEDSGSESDAGDEAKEPANEEPEAPAAEQPEASTPADKAGGGGYACHDYSAGGSECFYRGTKTGRDKRAC